MSASNFGPWLRLGSALVFSLTLLYLIVAISVGWFPETSVAGGRRQAAKTCIALVLAFGLVLTVARLFSALGNFLLDESFAVLTRDMYDTHKVRSNMGEEMDHTRPLEKYSDRNYSDRNYAAECYGNLGDRRTKHYLY